MATVNKDFKIKSGLIVEGSSATVGGYDILTKKAADQNYIIGLIGGAATSANEADTVVLRDEDGSFSAEVITADGGFVGNVTGTVSDISNHDTDDLTEGSNNLYFSEFRAQTGVSNALGSGLGYGSEGAGNVFYVDTNVIATKQFATDEANGALTSAQGYADGKATDAYNNAVETASQDATQKANNAQDAAEQFATNADSNLYMTVTNDINNATGDIQDNLDAHTTATSGVHGVSGEVVGTTDAQTISNKTLGSDLAAGGYKVSGLADPTADQDSATKAYVDDAISALVDSAPELLDTLNELAAAINDDASFATTIGNSIGEKVAKAGDSMSGDLDFGGTHSVTSLRAPNSSTDAATKGYVDQEISDLDTAAQGYANTAEENAIAHADSLTTTDIAEGTSLYFTDARAREAISDGDGISYNSSTGVISVDLGADSGLTTSDGTLKIKRSSVDTWYDANGAAATALQDAKDYADALDTDDIAEGSAQYFTDVRAKTSAAALIVGATKSNITITGDENGLVISAENGIADSTTDDLVEGEENLYFNDERAIDAISNADIYPNAVIIDNVAKQVASQLTAATAGVQTAHAWAKADYRSAEFLVKVAYGDHTEISKVLVTLDVNDNIAMTEYGVVGTNGSASSISANISGNNVQLQVTTTNNNSTVTVVGTLLA
jgi:hypothetical protein